MKTFKRRVQYAERKNVCGDKIRTIRLAKLVGPKRKMTQTELAERMSLQGSFMTRITIGRIENGTRDLSDIELIRFARALEVEIQELFFNDNSFRECAVTGKVYGRQWQKYGSVEKDDGCGKPA